MPFDVAGARKAGYSDGEIADFLAPTTKFDVSAARKSGYDDGEIVDFLSKAPEKPTWGDSAEYVGKSAVSGVKGVFGQGLGLAAGVYNSLFGLSDDEAAQLGKTAEGTDEIKRIRDASPFSKPGTAAEHASDTIVKSQNDTMASLSDGAKQFDDKIYLTLDRDKAAYLSPTKVAGDILNSLPSTLVLALSARFGGTAATEARTAALARGLSEEAANKAAVEAATKVITRAGAAGEGSLGYEQQYEQTRKQVLDTPEDKLAKSPEYQELLKEGYDADKARQVLAGRAGNMAGFAAGVVDAATNLASGKVLGHVIGEGGKLLPRTAKGFATESLEEGVQSAGEQLGGNYAIQQTSDPTQDLSEGVAESAAQGAVVGGLTGAAVGAGAGQHGILNEGPKVEDFAQPDQIDRYIEHRDNEKAGLGDVPGQSAAPNPQGWEINHAATPPSIADAAEAAKAAPPPSTVTPEQKVSVEKVLGAQDVDSAIAAAAEAAVASPTGTPRTSLDQMIDETKKSLDESLPNTQTKRQDAVDQLRTNLNIAAPLEVWEPNPAAPDASSITPEFAKAAREHYSQYGVDVVFVRDTKDLPFDGVVDEKQPNTIFMSSNPTRAMAQVAQHEVEHTMEEVELPDGRNLNQLLKQQVMEGLTSDAGLALELHSSTAPSRASFPSTPEGQAAHADAVLDHLYNEIGKDIGGDAPRFPAFVEKVIAAVEERYGNKTATDIFGKLVNGLRQSFNALQKFFKPSRMFESDKWVNNLDQIHNTIAKMHAAKIGEAQGLKDAAPTAENVIAEALTGKEANPTRAGPAPREGYEAAKNQATVYKRWLSELDTKRRSDAAKSPEVAALRAEEKTILGKVRGGEKYLTKTARNRLAKVRAEIEARVNPKEDNEDMARVRAKMVEAHGRMADAAAVTKEKKTEAPAAKSTGGEPVRIGKPAPRAEETGNPTDGDRFTANQLAQDTGGKPRFSPKKEESEKDEKPKRDHDAKITPLTIADEHEAEVAALIGTAKKDAKFSPKVEEKGPVFFSALERAVDGVKFEKAPPGQWLATIKNMPGIKAEEIQTTRIDKWLNAQTGPVTKAQVLEQLELGSVKVEEVDKGTEISDAEVKASRGYSDAEWGAISDERRREIRRDEANIKNYESDGARKTKFGNYVLPGGENYRELLMTLPPQAGSDVTTAEKFLRGEINGDPRARWPDDNKLLNEALRRGFSPSGSFKSSHWDEKNVLAHIRFDTRTGPNGEKILHIAEIQSDWHQIGRKEGYKDPERIAALKAKHDEAAAAVREATDAYVAARRTVETGYTDTDVDAFHAASTAKHAAEDAEHAARIAYVNARTDSVPDAPFKTTWHELAMKRMLRYAAENGYDRVSWDTGETNAERFDLSKSVSRIDWYKSATGKVHLEVFGLDGGIIHAGAHTLQELPNVIGKDLADKIAERMASPYTKEGSFEGEGLKVGGEGMRGFYDKILPAFVSKYVKKWGTKVERGAITTPDSDWQSEDEPDYIPDTKRVPVHSVEITPEMRRAVLQGQPKFSPKAKPTAKELTKEVPGLKKVVSNLAPDEVQNVSARTAERLVKLFTSLPSSEETAAVAFSGRAKRGWYKHSAQAIVDVFGQADGNRFAALLAALSPQTSVESNLENALKMWVNWNKAGRPTDSKAIGRLMGQSVQGTGGEASVLDAWRGNTIRALTDADPARPDFMLSGPKVNSFAKNLRNEVNEVTNDAWMATYAAIEPEMLASRRLINKRDNVGKSFGFKSDGYVAMSAMVRDAAKILTRKTGQTWTPAEVQETVWSWAKTLYERRDRAGEYRTAQQILKAADMTHEDVTSTPDFAVLLTRGLYRKILEGGNYGAAVDALEKSRGGDTSVGRPSGPSVSVTGAEGSGFAQSAFERHLQRAAARLERVRTDRLTAKGVNPRELIADARDSEIAANMSAATNSIPGIAQLAAAANAGDESAARLVNLIAHESLERLVATVPDAKLEVSRNGGLYGGALEPSLGVKITFPEKRRGGVLAALAKFASNFNQEQIHVRQPTIDPVGRVYTDGSYATPVYHFELETPLSRAEIEQVIAESGLYGLNFSDKKLEAYYVGDPRDEAARAEFGAAIERARDSLGERARSVGRSTARLWAYGIGDGATQGYDAIDGDVPRGTSEHTEVPRALAERELGHEVETSEQADEITEAQRLLQSKIADHYEQLPDNDMANPDVRRAYEELSKEIQKQFNALPVKVDVWSKPGEPYKSSADMRRDVLDNNHMWIFGTSTDTFGPPGADFHNHPLLQLTGRVSDNGFPLVVNDELRAVHDYYAHMLSPATFGPRGEETAWKNHLATIDNPWARWALTSETRGQNSWVNFGAHVEPGSKLADRPFARQKAALLPVEHMLTGNDAIDGPTYEFMRTMGDYGKNGSLPREVNDPFADFSPRVPSALREKLIRQDPAYKAMFAEPKKQLAIGKLPEAPTPKVVELPPPSDKEPRRKALQPIEGTGREEFRAINGALYNVGEEQPQMDRAARIVAEDPDRALAIAMLEQRPPAGVHPEFVFMALEEAAMLSQDVALQERLSRSRIAEEATTMGQRIAAWRNRAELSPVDDMRRIREARAARDKARGIDPEAQIDKVVNQAREFTRRTAKSNKRPSLNDFIMSIACKT